MCVYILENKFILKLGSKCNFAKRVEANNLVAVFHFHNVSSVFSLPF